MQSRNGQDLLALSDEEFGEIVDLDVRSQEPNPALRDPRIAPRWFDCLLSTKRNIEGQFGAEKKRMAALIFSAAQDPGDQALKQKVADERVRYTRWKSGALRFNSGLEARIQEARSLLPKEDPVRVLQEVFMLKAAIRRHRENIEPEDASAADLELWQLA